MNDIVQFEIYIYIHIYKGQGLQIIALIEVYWWFSVVWVVINIQQPKMSIIKKYF